MKDLNGYLEKMEKAMVEKLYFLEFLDLNEYDYVVDFGCANGALLASLKPIFTRTKFFGVDNNTVSISVAKQNPALKNVLFFNNLSEVKQTIKGNKKTALILSSVLHEIPNSFLDELLNFASNCSAIIIRDMFFDESFNKKCSDIKDMLLSSEFVESYQIDDFEKNHGKIDNTKNLYHFLFCL